MDICNDISRRLNELLINIAWYFDEMMNEINETKKDIENLKNRERKDKRRVQFYRDEDDNYEDYGNEDWIDEWDKV
tara:strand:- start:2933 stop:3160 length:228 start_codon:yes stop_codon:yes gene_type:complete